MAVSLFRQAFQQGVVFKRLRHRGWCAANPLPSLRAVVTVFVRRLPFGVLVIMGPLALWQADPGHSNPVVCVTSLEAPAPSRMGGEVLAPVEVSRCGPVKTTDALLTERFYTWTAPFARGVDVMHQFTDLLGIAVAGPEGNRVMGFGFPDQTIVWDGSALQSTYQVLLEEQSPAIPWRTVDIANGFTSSLAEEGQVRMPIERNDPPSAPIRALW